MKKILTTIIGLTAGTMLVHAQGWMQISGGSAAVTTNTDSYYNQNAAGATTGITTKGAALWDYAVLVSTTQITDGPADTGWTQVGAFGGSAIVAGGNGLSGGGIIYSGGNQFESSVAVGTYYVEIVGWSSNLGSSWTTVSAELTGNSGAGNWTASGFFGWSASATADFVTAGSSPGDNTFGVTGVSNGSLVLYAVSSPEPTTLALAGLGGLSMLFLRRRKS